MKKLIKSSILLVILLLVVFHIPIVVSAKVNVPAATSDFYVNDFANVFTSEQKSRLMANAVALANEHDGIQVVVTTVESLEGNTIESYTLEMYNQYEIGKNDMGILIFLSTGDRQIRVEVGKAMEGYINDSKAGRFIDKFAIPYLKENNFSEGLISLQEALIDEIVTSTKKDNITDASNGSGVSNVVSTKSPIATGSLSVLFYFIVLFFIVGIIVVVRLILNLFGKKLKENASLTKQLESSIEETAKVQNSYFELQEKFQQKINDFSREKESLTSDYQNLEAKYKALQDRYRRVQLLYPTADKDVTNMIEEEIRQRDMVLAGKVDSEIQQVLLSRPSKDIVEQLSEIQSRYSELNSKQRSYVTSDIGKFQQLYRESKKLKQEYDKMVEEENNKKLAAEAVASIMAIISCISIGRAGDLGNLRKAKSIYNNLASSAHPYFDTSVASRLDTLYRQAKIDQEREEAEEERRRMRQREEARRMSMQNTSSFRSISHHRGFGGHSGGSGASRGF